MIISYEFEFNEYVRVTINDFIDDTNLTSVNLAGNLINNEIPIDNICEESEILIFLDKIIKNNNLDKNKYNIYFQRNNEWYNKFIFYEKK